MEVARTTADSRMDRGTMMGAFAGEHLMAYLFAFGAFALAAIGLLEGFGIINIADAAANTANSVGTSTGATGGVSAGSTGSDFHDGILWLIPAATAAILSLYFHISGHHLGGAIDGRARTDMDDSNVWVMEHGMAILAAGAAVVLAAIGILTGFGVFGDQTFEDGMLWEVASIIPAVVSCTLHLVGHHSMPMETTRASR
jgi:hypothetical protein